MEDTKLKASQHEAYGQLTLITVLIPIVGVIAGIVYLTRPNALDRKLGEHLLAVGILSSILAGILWFVVMGGFSQPTMTYTVSPY